MPKTIDEAVRDALGNYNVQVLMLQMQVETLLAENAALKAAAPTPAPPAGEP